MPKLTWIAMAACLALPAPLQARAPGPEAQAETEAAPEERLICKTTREIGSLVKKKKTCLTAREWKMAREYNRKNWQEASDSCRNRYNGGQGC